MRAFQNCSAVGYQGLVTPAKAFFEAGGFDERFEGDVGTADYCLRLRNLGYRIVQMPTVKVECEEKSPVSYTHLDVYKRQELHRHLFACRSHTRKIHSAVLV